MRKEETVEILDKVLEFSNSKGLFDCGIIVIGLSGGPDSVALLHILKGLRNCFDIDCDIYALHCNHHLRPGACDEEAELVKQLCEDNHVKLKVLDFDCRGFAESNHISEETAGRVLRYEAFEQYAKALEEASHKTVRVAVAHHKDDVAETMMMNLFRGSGLDGLVNPKAVSGRIIRPLLCLRKSELVDYLDTLGVSYAIDQTNLTTEGTRNNWRNDMLPKIGGFYGVDPVVPLARTYRLLSDDLDFISGMAFDAYAGNRKELSGYPVLKVSVIKDLHQALKSRVIRSLWLESFGNLTDFEESNLKDCADLIADEALGEVMIDMPFGRKAYRYGDYFGFAGSDGIEFLSGAIAREMGFVVSENAVNTVICFSDVTGNGENSIKIPNSSLKLRALRIENIGDLEYNNFSWFCPVDVIRDGGITLGNCKGTGTGLRMRRAGSEGSKEIKRLMTDLKIPESARKQIIFMEKDGDILWLPGFGHGTGFTNAISRERYIANMPGSGSKPDELVMFTIERQ